MNGETVRTTSHGTDMPVVISLYNALTGLAVAFEGYVLGNPAMIIAGMVVGAAGTMLTQLMARAMNRSLANVLFSGFGGALSGGAPAAVAGTSRLIDADDAAIMMAYADKVVIAPGYGMAVAQAQHKVWELAQLLLDRGVQVRHDRRGARHRRQRHREPGSPDRSGEPYLRDADTRCRQSPERRRDQARRRRRLCRRREPAVCRRQRADAL
jgi:uncharacterized protein (DUF779 family)